MGPLKSFHKFFEGVRLSAPKKLDQKSAVAPPACCGCSRRKDVLLLRLHEEDANGRHRMHDEAGTGRRR